MYRWDINVRIDHHRLCRQRRHRFPHLQQNINLLNYRAASARIIAIAIVVSASGLPEFGIAPTDAVDDSASSRLT
ncbi:MAG: hypothetical protein R2851_20450 [Caldilineaceae bacterium]